VTISIPNALSIYRLAVVPVIAGTALAGHRDAFFILVIISLATDLVDGPIARLTGQESRYGAKLDTIADACTLLVGILGVYIFEGHNLASELLWLYVFLASYATAALTSLAKFGVLPAYHLYTSKVAAFVAATFFIWLFLKGYSDIFLLVVLSIGVLANVESLVVTLRLKHFRTDIRSIFSVAFHARDIDG